MIGLTAILERQRQKICSDEERQSTVMWRGKEGEFTEINKGVITVERDRERREAGR